MIEQKGKKMTREEAVALYNQLQSNVSRIMRGKVPPKVQRPGAPMQGAVKPARAEGAVPTTITVERDKGVVAALCFLLFCGMMKVCVGVSASVGVFDAVPAQAALVQEAEQRGRVPHDPAQPFSSEQVRVLTSLDARRAQLDERARKLEEQERDLSRRDKEYVVKLAELRELTEKLKVERHKDEKKDSAQLDQLANIYGSMAPQEAARLIEQLDVTIAMPLLQRMPEKRMGLILPLMSPEKALMITKLLTGQS